MNEPYAPPRIPRFRLPSQQPSTEPTLPMVSHAEVTASSRRAPSVASHGSRSRQPPRACLNHGGASAAVQNEFPFFAQTGDVEIVIECNGQEKRYLLHRLMLAQFSSFFETGTAEEWSRRTEGQQATPSSSRPGPPSHNLTGSSSGRHRWRFELNWADVAEDEEPVLVQKNAPEGPLFAPAPSQQPPVPLRPKPPPQSFFRSVANLTVRPTHTAVASQSVANLTMPPDPALNNPLLRDYDNLFRIFYNYAPILNAVNIASAYSECKSLLSVADLYDTVHVVGPRVEHHLLAFSSRLFKQIAKYPPSYLKLGYLARSKVIFSEALTHVIGQWPSAHPYLRPSNRPGVGYEVPPSVVDLIEDKVDELEEIKQRVEAKLFRLVLTTSRGERVNPSNDYLGWLATSLFRQWVAENTTPEPRGILRNGGNGSRPSSGAGTRPGGNAGVNVVVDAGAGAGAHVHAGPLAAVSNPAPASHSGRIYRLVASTNSQSYLPHEELKRFLKLHPAASSSATLYSRDNLRRFERKMEQIKNVARDLVKPLTRNCLELDVRTLSDGQGGGLGYLTCMKLEEGELPWD